MAHNNGNSDNIPERKPTKKWPVWAGGAVVVALVAGAIGVAIGTSNNDNDDSANAANTVEAVKPVETVEAIDEADEAEEIETAEPDETQMPANTASAATGISTVEEAAAHFNTATSVVAGAPSGIDLNRDGSWDVEIMESANTEVTVRIHPDGTTQVVDSDREETTGTLSQADITKIFDVALTDTSGTIVSLDADDGQDREAFTVEVLNTDGTQVTELDLDSNYTIIDREVEAASDYFD